MNNWYVITGAPSSGKTTVVKLLEQQGHKVQYEWARIYIDEEVKNGKTINEIRKDEVSFQRKILKLKVDFEKKLAKDQFIFMERGIPDTTAYMRLLGIKSDPGLEKALKNCNYKKVFLLELLEYESNYARTESEEEAKILEELLEQSYRDLGSNILKVPKMPPDERISFILNHL